MASPSPSPSPSRKLLFLIFLSMAIITTVATAQGVGVGGGGGSWCVARSDATDLALQTALDYTCGAGADCLPIQSNGLCYLPNTLQAHASYAFNSFYQRKARAPGSCDFVGASTIAQTDPSYGSCEYPSSASTAGGTNTPITAPPSNNQNVPTPIYGGGGGGGGLNPGMNPPISDNSRAPSKAVTTSFLVFFTSLLILSLSS